MPAVGRCSQKMKKNDREIFHLFGGGEERGELFLFVLFIFGLLPWLSFWLFCKRERERVGTKNTHQISRRKKAELLIERTKRNATRRRERGERGRGNGGQKGS